MPSRAGEESSAVNREPHMVTKERRMAREWSGETGERHRARGGATDPVAHRRTWRGWASFCQFGTATSKKSGARIGDNLLRAVRDPRTARSDFY